MTGVQTCALPICFPVTINGNRTSFGCDFAAEALRRFKESKTAVRMESSTGKILAMVGGVDYNQSVFNRAFQSKRQAGSAIKPFLYQTALNEGYNPASQLFDIGRTYTYTVNGQQKKWQPKNYGGNFQGIVSLRDSLVQSRNLSTLNLVTDVGVNTTTDDLKRYGFKDIVDNLSVTLGSMSVNLIEFSQAYTIFSNNGVQVKPYIVEQIVNKDGKSVTFEPQKKSLILLSNHI